MDQTTPYNTRFELVLSVTENRMQNALDMLKVYTEENEMKINKRRQK